MVTPNPYYRLQCQHPDLARLSAVLADGLEGVEDAVREALEAGTASDDVILNML